MMSIPLELQEEGERAIEENAASAVEFIRDRPLIAVAIAAALGFIIAQVVF
jgi:ElaB/YqjD/DUF883 family membrane-anchored ribosome-binding protein